MLPPGEPAGGSGRSLRPAAALTALVVLLGLVAFASRSGLGGSSHARPSPGYVSWAVSVLFVLWLMMIPLAAYAYWLRLHESGAEPRRRSQGRSVRGLAFILLAGVGAILYMRARHLFFGSAAHVPHFLGGVAGVSGKRGAHPYDPTFQWPVLWAALALLAAAGVLMWHLGRHRGSLPVAGAQDDPSVADDVARSISDAIDDLAAEPDARRAVIAAYARMERVFARNGLDRVPSETPVEYLRRLLLGLTSRADAVTRLTGLFERAKFSRHEIDGAMKQDAIDALRAIRDDLQPA
jgi:uncharacterized protein DUF4129